jgi:S1-C subfamily serine protease
MRRWLMRIFAILLMLCSSAYGAQQPVEVLRAVVKIRATVPEHASTAAILGTEREGSGVLIDTDGHVLTIGYLILEGDTIEVVGPDGKAVGATFVAYDQESGFGIVRADQPVRVTPVKLGNSSLLSVGDPVLVVGHGGEESVQGARIISLQEFAGYWEYLLDEAIFTSPPYANFGGAALIGSDGRLLGVGSLYPNVTVPGFGPFPCNMFVPIDLLKPILEDLLKLGRRRQPPRPWLGLQAEETHGRVIVTRVTKGGPSENAGLESGDVILTVKEEKVQGLADFYRKLWSVGQAGVQVPMRILHGIEIRDVLIQSADRNSHLKVRPRK